MTQAFEVHRMLCLSTAHIRGSTASDLILRTNDVPISYPKDSGGGPVGWFIPILDPYPDGIPSTCPDDLLGLFAFARKIGFTWLMLDSDGPILEGLPTWEW